MAIQLGRTGPSVRPVKPIKTNLPVFILGIVSEKADIPFMQTLSLSEVQQHLTELVASRLWRKTLDTESRTQPLHRISQKQKQPHRLMARRCNWFLDSMAAGSNIVINDNDSGKSEGSDSRIVGV